MNKYERNAFIGEFIFGKCIIPILINPDYDAVISSTILSVNTKRALKCIAKVLIKVSRGIFFESHLDTEYTIFNHYIIEVISEINKFYDDLIDVTLPKTLDHYINDDISLTDLKYDYFAENPEELLNIQSICFSVQDIIIIIKHLRTVGVNYKLDNIIYKILEKVSNYEEDLEQIARYDSPRKFFLIFNNINNPQLENMLYPKNFKFTFTSNKENTEFLVNQIKFCIKLILRGLNMLNVKVYSHFIKADSTENFFIALNQIIELEEFSEVELIEKIPINWYSLFMKSNIHLLEEKYKQHDYNQLYNELLKEGKDELNFLNYKNNLVVARYGMNKRCMEKIIENLKRYLNKIKQIQKYLKIEHFIKNTQVEVCIRINNKDDNKDKSSFFGLFSRNDSGSKKKSQEFEEG